MKDGSRSRAFCGHFGWDRLALLVACVAFLGPDRVDGELSPEVEGYWQETGISAASADKITRMLDGLRDAGVEPSFLWIGGASFNSSDQTHAVIGEAGEIIDTSGGSFVVGEDHVRFRNGDFLRFPLPESLRGDSRSELFFGVWYEASETTSSASTIFACYDDAAPGPELMVDVNRRVQARFRCITDLSHPVGAAMLGASARTFAGPRFWASWIRNGEVDAAHLSEVGLREDFPMSSPVAEGVFNNHTHLTIGGLKVGSDNPNVRARAKVLAVVIAERLNPPPGAVARSELARVSGVPVTAGLHAPAPANWPAVFTLGDSTTANGWNSFLSGARPDSAPFGGAWVGRCAMANFAIWGYNINQLIALTPEYEARIGNAPFEKKILIYTCEPYSNFNHEADELGVSDLDGWYDATGEWMREIEAATGCEIVLASYVKGWSEGGSPETRRADRDAVHDLCLENDWRFIDLWSDPHALVHGATYQETVDYGFYRDDDPARASLIHMTEAGHKIQAERVAAYLSHPESMSPRADAENPPVIEGRAVIGDVLVCSTGGWFNDPDSFDYQWLANLAEIPGATGPSLAVGAAQSGKRIACRVIAIKAGMPVASFTSAPTDMVPFNRVVTVMGSGGFQRLTIDIGTGSGILEHQLTAGASFTLQASDDVGQADPFVDVLQFEGGGGPVVVPFNDSGAIGKPKRFYRIIER